MSELASRDAARLRRWQRVTVGTLFTGYAGYYICRSNLSVVTPLLLEEYADAGLTKGQIGDIASFGVLFYAIGKTINGVLTEYVGGKRMFLIGIFGSVLCTLIFASLPLFLGAILIAPFAIIWSANRFVQSMGWGGLVQITTHWFPATRLATIMGVLSMSYLLGDAAARLFLGGVISAGAGWQGVYLASAIAFGLIGLGCFVFLKDRPSHLGLPDAPPPPGNVYGDSSSDQRLSIAKLLLPLLNNFAFWLVCLMNIGLTLIRETFNLWNPTYLREVVQLAPDVAGMTSLIFPLVGAVSSLFAGRLVDRLGGNYGWILIPSLLGLTLVLVIMACAPIAEFPVRVRTAIALSMISLVAFFLLAPYTFCSGVLAMKIGGQKGGATATGIVDTAGYLGATLAGSGIGRIAQAHGWGTAFGSLALVTLFTLIFAIIFSRTSRRGVASP